MPRELMLLLKVPNNVSVKSAKRSNVSIWEYNKNSRDYWKKKEREVILQMEILM